MSQRPGATLSRRPLHFFVVADCSGSMDSDGKIQALNHALRETVPHLVEVANGNPHAEVLIRVIAFSTGATWHVAEPTPIDQFRWHNLEAGGFTDLGAALELLTQALEPGVMEERALPPAIILISDGMPTDEEWENQLEHLLSRPWGQRAVRMAVGIGRDAEFDVLARFTGPGDIRPVSAHNPEQLIRMIRWASVHASRAASSLQPAPQHGPTPTDPLSEDLLW